MSENFDPYHKWLGIPPEKQPPTHYQLLGVVEFESDIEVLEIAAERQMAHVHSHKTGPHSELSQKLLNEISQAKLTLIDDQKREAYNKTIQPVEDEPSADLTTQSVSQAPGVPSSPNPQWGAVANPTPNSSLTQSSSSLNQALPQNQPNSLSQSSANWGASQPVNPPAAMNPPMSFAEIPLSTNTQVEEKQKLPDWLIPVLAVGSVAILLVVFLIASSGSGEDPTLANQVQQPIPPANQPEDNPPPAITPPAPAPPIAGPTPPPPTIPAENPEPNTDSVPEANNTGPEPIGNEDYVEATNGTESSQNSTQEPIQTNPIVKGPIEVPDHPKFYRKDILGKHIGTITSLTISSDKRLAASSSIDGEIKIWDLQAGGTIGSIRIPREKTKSPDFITMRFNEDASVLTAVNSYTGIFRISLTSGELIESVIPPEPERTTRTTSSGVRTYTRRIYTRDAIISKDGKLVAYLGNYQLYIWKSGSSNAKLQTSSSLEGLQRGLAFTQDEKGVIVNARSNLTVWSINDQKIEQHHPTYGSSEKLRLHPDGETVAKVSRSPTINFFNLNTGVKKGSATVIGSYIYDATYSQNGFYMIVSQDDNAIRIINTHTKRNHATLRPNIDRMIGHVASEDGQIIITAGRTDKLVTIFRGVDIANMSEEEIAKLSPYYDSDALFTVELENNNSANVQFSKSGDKIIYTDLNKIWLIKSDTGELVESQIHEDFEVYKSDDPRLFADGKRILSYQGRKHYIWDIETGKTLKAIPIKEGSPESMVTISDDDRRFAYFDRYLQANNLPTKVIFYVHNLQTDEVVKSPMLTTGDIQCIQFSPDGSKLLIAAADKRVYVWNIENGADPADRIVTNDITKKIHFSKDKKRVYLIGTTVLQYDAETFEKLKDIRFYKYKLEENHICAINPDETLFASGSDDKKISIFDMKTRKLVKEIDEHRAQIKSLEFSPDGTKLVTSAADSTVRMWDLEKLLGPKWKPKPAE